MKTRIIQVNPKKHTMIFDQLPPNLASGDVIIASPSGEIRNHFDYKWYQKLWVKIDKKMRSWLKI